MRHLLPIVGITMLALACGTRGGEEIIVTRDHFGSEWPLQVNSARLECGDAAVLRIGQKRYALDEAGLASGLPDAREVAARRPHPDDPAHASRAADLAPLREACGGLAHVASQP